MSFYHSFSHSFTIFSILCLYFFSACCFHPYLLRLMMSYFPCIIIQLIHLVIREPVMASSEPASLSLFGVFSHRSRKICLNMGWYHGSHLGPVAKKEALIHLSYPINECVRNISSLCFPTFMFFVLLTKEKSMNLARFLHKFTVFHTTVYCFLWWKSAMA